MDLNQTDLESLLQISTEQDTLGFDLRAGTTWIYPTNYPIRDYQYNIVQSALYENTLVSLPTGLGKTFIAAVIMYNFYRWYPTGKIIFMAPTKPLVRQQIDACYNIMAIPPDVTSEITGAKITASRVNIWKEKRVFFITPHILQNDLETIPDLGPKIRCVVIDEAHKALGRQANCEVMRKLKEVNTNFRVLALSATPGSNFKNITEVITNLLISHIECRTDESVDVAPYVFNRQLETVVIPLGGMLQNIKEQYLQILDQYTRPLIKFNVLSGNCAMMTKGKILLTMRDYKENCRNRNNYNQIMCNFTICITLYHGYELLIRHGLRSFLTFFEANIDKPLINSINNLRAIISEVRDYLGPNPSIDVLPDGTIPDIPEETKFGHPKFYKLADVLSLHFQNADNSTRAMVFCEYRESVNEAYMLLLKHRPVIRPKIFIGKGTGTGQGQTQAQQLLAIKMFREGKCNTLIATCIGEEGIDVGEVDLIVCFDISTKSPVRMVQRMGRTGRKRNGRVVILVTEGREQQTLQECLIQKSCMNNLLNSNHISNYFYENNPRMIPDGLKPSCTKIFITVPKKADPKNKKAKNTVKNMFESLSSTQSSTKTESEYDISDVCTVPEFNKLPEPYEYWSKSKENLFDSKENCNKIFSKRLEKQLQTHSFFTVGHSTLTEAFVALLKFSDKKKYNLPTTQSKNISQRFREEPLTASQVNNFVQVDIRNMFKPRLPKISDTIQIEDDMEPPLNNIISSINNYIKYDIESEMCEICNNFFRCSNICQIETGEKDDSLWKNWILPDYSVIDNLNNESLTAFMNTLKINIENDNSEITNENDDTKEKSRLNETLEFFKLKDLESIFNDDDFNETSSPKKIVSNDENMKNINLLITPPKIYNDIVDVSPVLFSADRVQNFQSKLKRLSQASQNQSFTSDNEPKKCRKSFDFNKMEKISESPEKRDRASSGETECYNYDALNDSREIFSDDNDVNKINEDVNRTVEDVIVNNMNYNSDEMDVFFDNLEVIERQEESKGLETVTVQEESKKVNGSKNDDFFNESIKDLKNIESMFDVGDLSLFDSSGETKSQKSCKEVVENPLEVDFDIGDEFIFESDNENDNDTVDIKQPSNSPNLDKNIESKSPIIKDNNEYDSAILNDVINIEESNSPILSNCRIDNKNFSTSEKTINYQLSPILSKSRSVFNSNSQRSKKSSEETATSNYFDPDEMILISSDEENDFVKSPKLSNKKINLMKLSKLRASQMNSSQLNQSVKTVNSPQFNKSVVNQTNSSLLSVTQILNLINDDSNLDSSIKENVMDKNEVILKDKQSEVKNLLNLDVKSVVGNRSNQMILSEKIVNKIEDKFLGNSQNTRRESTPKNYNKKTSFFENDLSDFEPTLSSPKWSKLNEKSSVSNKKVNEKLKSNEDEIFSKIVWDDLDDFEIPTITQRNKQTVKEKIEDKRKNESPIDWLDDDSLLKFSYNSPWKKNPNDENKTCSNEDTDRNTKQINRVDKEINQSVSKSPVCATQDSPIKIKRNVVRKIALSDSDDDFEEKQIEVFKKPLTTPKKEPSTSKINLKRLNENKTEQRCEKKKILLKLKEKRKVNNPFIQDEAEIEDDEAYTSDSGDSDDIDALESSFIADSQINVSPEVDIHAKYLQSVRSPIRKHGGFKIPQRISRYTNVFSQTDDINEENTYIQDSFCVDTESTLKFNDDLSYLEQAEMEIERQRKKKRKRSEKSPKKRKRLMQCYSDSD